MLVLLQLESRQLSSGWKNEAINPKNINPKNYPHRERLIELLKEKGYEIKEIKEKIPLAESKKLIQEADLIICIDSYLQHLCWYVGKQAIVIWGISDPEIFGHSENINILKDRSYLRKDQMLRWEQAPYVPESFSPPEDIMKEIEKMV